MKIDPKIFKAYDIRGIYPDEINEDAARQIAKAFVKFLNPKSIVVGRDMRNSSKALHKPFVEGLVDMGVTVYDVGLSSTPMLYWSVQHLGVDGGVIMTASHNPLEYGGLKFVNKKTFPIFIETGLKEIARLSKETFTKSRNPGKHIQVQDVLKDYNEFHNKFNQQFKPLKVVVDAMHGAIGPAVKGFFEKTNLDVTYLSIESISDIPGYKTPNPLLTENQKNIIQTIHKNKADIGFMWDGDGDRLAVFDKDGEIVSPNFVASMVAEEVLKKEKGNIVGELRFSQLLEETAKKYGSSFFRTKVGNPFIKQKMIDEKGVFGAETAGHYIFSETNFGEDTILAAIYLLKNLSEQTKSSEEIFKELKDKYYFGKEINLRTEKENILDIVQRKYEPGEVEWLDGITVNFPDFWFNIRKSNNEPLIRVNFDGVSKEVIEKEKEKLLELLYENGCVLADY